jgi:hypothetical protein
MSTTRASRCRENTEVCPFASTLCFGLLERWHGRCLIICMLAFIAVISGIFGVGFTVGYAIRDIISRRRRRQFWRQRNFDDAADHPSFVPDSADLGFTAQTGFVPINSPLPTSGLTAVTPPDDKLKSD